MKTVKELKVIAKEMNIKGYSAMNKQQLLEAIEMASKVEARVGLMAATDMNPFDDDNNGSNNVDDGFFVDDADVSADTPADVVTHQQVQQAKRIQFIKADNVQVYFRAAGQIVKVYWSTEDFRLHIRSERRGDRHTKYAELVRMFKPLKNGVDGDVARVMKAIVRIKDMPAAIKAIRMKHLVETGKVARPQTKEKAESANRTRGVVDAQWMQRFVVAFEEMEGRRPTGLEIRNAWIEELERRGA